MPEPLRWAALGPAALLDALAPLLRVRCEHGPAALVAGNPRAFTEVARELAPHCLLVIEDPTASAIRPTDAGPFLATGHGPPTLVGRLRLGRPQLEAYAHLAVSIEQRHHRERHAVVLLGAWEQRYLDLLDRLEAVLVRARRWRTFRWSAERVRRPALLDGLGAGAGVVLYTGHGNAEGWRAYGGIGAGDLAYADAGHATALLFSLACRTGRGPDGFADRVVAGGAVGAVFAPPGDPLHHENARLAHGLAHALADGRTRLRDILTFAWEGHGCGLDGYAVFGDPATCASGSPVACNRAAAVFAPAADADLAAACSAGLRPNDSARGPKSLPIFGAHRGSGQRTLNDSAGNSVRLEKFDCADGSRQFLYD